MTPITGLHLELTTRCTLSCPRCARTDLINELGKIQISDLDINHLRSFLDADLTKCNILLNGNLGDPIYHPEFLAIFNFLKERNPASIKLITNGSYRTASWWRDFSTCLRENDSVIFSIDGTPNNFTNYRVNGDWVSIKVAIETMVASPAKVVWKFIPFRFNEDTIEEARAVAYKLGVDTFSISPSDRWIKDDHLRPIRFVSPLRPGSGVKFDPQCKKKETIHFVSADGFFFPCCYAADYRLVKGTVFDGEQCYNISSSTASSHLIDTSDYSKFLQNLESNKITACKFCCTK